MKIAVTGHRKLGDLQESTVKRALQLFLEEGDCTFYVGMAYGFDLLVAKCLQELKEVYPNLCWIACVPCKNQELRYSKDNKVLYRTLLQQANQVVYVSENPYTYNCMWKRDEYMVNEADVVFSYCVQQKGGTVYTVNYAKRKGKKVYNVNQAVGDFSLKTLLEQQAEQIKFE